MVDKAKEALEKVRAERERNAADQVAPVGSQVRQDRINEQVDGDNRREEEPELSQRTRDEIEEGLKSSRREREHRGMRQAGRTMVTETDGTPVPTDPDAPV